jgi:hypothetical protein
MATLFASWFVGSLVLDLLLITWAREGLLRSLRDSSTQRVFAIPVPAAPPACQPVTNQ